jgi:hypothetical protein
MKFLCGTLTFPEKTIPVSVHSSVGSISQQEETHCMKRQVGQACVDKRQTSRRGHEPSLPRGSTFAYRGHQRLQVSHSKFVITHGETQVRKGKLSLHTIQQTGYPSLFSNIHSHHNHLTFMEVDFHSGQEFKAQQQELEIR